MATTTNFGWATPDDTDFVKDGAAAIRTLGSSIDTSLVDLKGGTTGQILAKASNTDLDYSWITNDIGDITAVTAGTGISGGGSSGDVTITNSMATAIDAKGDLIAGTGSDTFSRLAVGTNNHVLTADSSTATGLKWAAPSAATPTFDGAFAFSTSNQSISNVTFTVINFNTESYDTKSYHDNSTNNGRLTIPSGNAGYYQFTALVRFAVNGTGRRIAAIQKNGSTDVCYVEVQNATTASANTSILLSAQTYGAVGDYFHVVAYQSSGGALNVESGVGNTYFSLNYLGA
jgi:hypothetical protein